jgi:hypothetical protein
MLTPSFRGWLWYPFVASGIVVFVRRADARQETITTDPIAGVGALVSVIGVLFRLAIEEGTTVGREGRKSLG